MPEWISVLVFGREPISSEYHKMFVFTVGVCVNVRLHSIKKRKIVQTWNVKGNGGKEVLEKKNLQPTGAGDTTLTQQDLK